MQAVCLKKPKKAQKWSQLRSAIRGSNNLTTKMFWLCLNRYKHLKIVMNANKCAIIFHYIIEKTSIKIKLNLKN